MKLFQGRIYILILLFSICPIVVNAQSGSESLKKVEKAFASFEYENVIRLSDSLLKTTNLDTTQLIEILRLKAISHYILNQEDLATFTFVHLLQINDHYSLDPILNSPKIINFFEKVKRNYLKTKMTNTIQGDKKKFIPPKQINNTTQFYRKIFWRSFLLPGWGHLTQKSSLKGWTLMGLSIATISATVYYSFYTQKLEKDYLNSFEQKKIDQAYDNYNRAFKTRNILVLSYVALWSYCQLDLVKQIEKTLKLNPEAIKIDPHYQIYAIQISFTF